MDKKLMHILILTIIIFMIFIPLAYAKAEGWMLLTNSPGSLDDPVFTRNGYIYYLANNGYAYTNILLNGVLGTWTFVVKPFQPYGLWGSSVVTTNEIIYISGGHPDNTMHPPYSWIKYAGFLPDGSLSDLSANPHSMLTPRAYHGTLIINKRFYVMGGYADSVGLNPLNTVEYGTLNTNSTIGTMQYTNSFQNIMGPIYLTWFSGNTIFCLGAITSQSGSSIMERSLIQPDGSLGAWTTIGGPYNFQGKAAINNRNTIIVVKNWDGSNYNQAIKSNFSYTSWSDNWVSAPNTINPRVSASIVSWDQFVYLIGGQNPINYAYDYTVELYDPDLTDCPLVDDEDIKIQSINEISILTDIK